MSQHEKDFNDASADNNSVFSGRLSVDPPGSDPYERALSRTNHIVYGDAYAKGYDDGYADAKFHYYLPIPSANGKSNGVTEPKTDANGIPQPFRNPYREPEPDSDPHI